MSCTKVNKRQVYSTDMTLKRIQIYVKNTHISQGIPIFLSKPYDQTAQLYGMPAPILKPKEHKGTK